MGGMKRQAFSIAVAVLLPLLILAGFQLYISVNARRLELEALSRQRAAEVMRLVDAEMTAEMKLATVLSSSVALRRGDMANAYVRAQEVARVAQVWRTVRLSDPATGREIFDLRRPLDAGPRSLGPDVTALARATNSGPRIGGVEPDRAGGHAVAMQRFPHEGVVSAVVDRQGRFISRSLGYADRVGHDGSTFLRAAVRRGGEGFYRGVTLEGTATYTAYVTSSLTGWSTHVALPTTAFDAARVWSMAIWSFVTLGCIALSGLMIWLMLRDLSQARQEEERLRQSQKMEAVGHLTGGIAHDFNNLLTAIIGGLDLMLRRENLDARDRRYAEGALDAAQRGARLTARLLAFSRTHRLGVEAVDIEAVLDGMMDLLQQSLGPGVEVAVVVDPEARWVRTDANQLELALLNLAVNSRDAMPDGGVITIAARPVVHRRNRKDWPCVALSVSDTGTGMEPQVLARALDPFFTTKAVSKGTGLGLAQVYALARQSGGDVKLSSTVGKGTQVSLMLPIADERPTSESAPERRLAPDGEVGSSGARILVLDDDDSVREVLVENLRARGYAVFQAADGEDALLALPDIDPDLFILDFLMPGLNGAEVARRARQIRPAQKLLIVSGHLDSGALSATVDDVEILQKPFDGPTLARRVAQILGADHRLTTQGRSRSRR